MEAAKSVVEPLTASSVHQLQPVEFKAVLNLPTSQAVQEVAPCPLQNPTGQGSHFVLFAEAKKPAEHVEQTVAFLAETEPSLHSVQPLEARPLQNPASQPTHVAASALAYLPASHGSQKLAPSGLLLTNPASQVLQRMSPTTLNSPAGHALHLSVSKTSKTRTFPASQDVHPTFATPTLYSSHGQ